ncbi:MAG: DinB family protein [Candidatus Rokuibacteriota bacterium]
MDTTSLRGEVESFQHFIFNTIDSIVGALDGLSADQLNWRPDAPDTNSLYAIATHVLGNAEENLLGTLCGQRHARHYATEFTAAAPTPDAIRARWAELRQRVATSLAALTPADLESRRQHPRRGAITGRDVLVVVARHAAEHWGEVQLTRSLIKAAAAR